MILITGGAGYIGAHTNKALHNAGYETVVVDNLCKGYENFVKWGNFENYDFGSSDLREVFEKYDIDGVIHFAAFHQWLNLFKCHRNTLKIIIKTL